MSKTNLIDELFIGEAEGEDDVTLKQEDNKEDDVTLDPKNAKKIAGKFTSVEELEKAYASLEKRLGDHAPLKDLNDEALVGKVKEIFSDLKNDTTLEGDLGSWAKQYSEETGIPQKFVDKIVADTASKAIGNVAAKRKSEVSAYLKDAEIMENFVNGLEAKGEDVKDWQKEINAGNVTKKVVEKFAKMGKPSKEADSIVTDNAPKMTQKEATDRVLRLMGDPVYSNPRHPNYKEYHKEVTFLEKKYGV